MLFFVFCQYFGFTFHSLIATFRFSGGVLTKSIVNFSFRWDLPSPHRGKLKFIPCFNNNKNAWPSFHTTSYRHIEIELQMEFVLAPISVHHHYSWTPYSFGHLWRAFYRCSPRMTWCNLPWWRLCCDWRALHRLAGASHLSFPSLIFLGNFARMVNRASLRCHSWGVCSRTWTTSESERKKVQFNFGHKLRIFEIQHFRRKIVSFNLTIAS